MMKPPSSVFQLPGFLQRCSNLNSFHTKLNTKLKPYTEGEENTINKDLEEIIDFKTRNTSSWVIETKVNSLCLKYNILTKDERAKFLSSLATRYAVNHDKICQANNPNQLISRERALKDALTPPYINWMADPSPRGMANSSGIMINYRQVNIRKQF
ncbi:malonyl-CoA decarboxylase, mitochondrial-like [Nasonia vitripennis]|uniref:Malonyl-CoA decarboxylase C-terminal domain-containing protein n=1 Tax=Nasonia vitripennis TaxID=7425 RepID=A0A7M7QM68_NASVI|nr:malonyl-CoA decarboxylase, mitochondrial-like [Nasonia vitripennis]